MTKRKLRSWSASSSERSWAISIAVLCLLLLSSVTFWPSEDTIKANSSNSTEKAKVAVPMPPTKTDLPLTSQPSKKKEPVSITTAKKTEQSSSKQHRTVTSPIAFFIQVGAFQSQSHAKRLSQQLNTKHWPAIIHKKKELIYCASRTL